MNIKNLPAVSPIQAKPAAKTGTDKAVTDKAVRDKSTAAHQAEEASTTRLTIEAARRVATQQRSVRLEQLEGAIRSGHYVPNASQIANQLLASAELDAKLRVMLAMP